MNIKKLFYEPYWECFYRKPDTPYLTEQQEDTLSWMKIIVPRRYWCADPFLINYSGEEYIFCEVMDRKESYGKIGCGKIVDGKPTYIETIIDIGCHTSYPNLFEWNGELYMIPETVERHTIELYKCESFPSEWKKVSILMSNTNAVDTTIFKNNGELQIFIYEQDQDSRKLSIAEIDMEKYSIKNRCYVKEYNEKVGRPAGNVFKLNNELYRPTQYGINFYGEKIVFQKFSVLQYNGYLQYEESESYSIRTSNYSKELGNKFVGTHTYNYDNCYEVVDCFRYKFYLERPLEMAMKVLKIGGYKFRGR